ncbi:hypothetical protein Gohar_017279, partial [Gossypium harknessii]|nr:hypothetical protein [Gossypium harknessii]
MEETLSPVDFVVGTDSASSNSGMGRATKKTETMNMARISNKTKLMGDSVSHNSMVDLEEDFELQDGDVTTVLVDGVPSIIFFDRVQQFIAWKMALIVVVKLVGKIGFKTLFNKVSSLWKQRGQFQLMDLENDFYLVRFQDKDDFDKILMGGPWVIFGHYLTIRPWSLDFSATNKEVDNQIVWIRLLGLSGGYYLKTLLRTIRKAIGSVIKTDEHTNAAIRG